MKKIDELVLQIKSILSEGKIVFVEDPLKGGIPLNSEGRVFCFRQGRKTFKVVIWDVSEQVK